MGQDYTFPVMEKGAGLASRHCKKKRTIASANLLIAYFLIDGAIYIVTLGFLQEILSDQDP